MNKSPPQPEGINVRQALPDTLSVQKHLKRVRVEERLLSTGDTMD